MNRILLACYDRFLFLYPRPFRLQYGRELQLFMRDYTRDNRGLAVMLFMFSDLLISLPREYVKEVSMHLNSRSIAAVAGGAFLIAMAIIMVVQDINNPLDKMGFFATLVTCTIALAGSALLTMPARPGARFLWLIPATYAAAAATWIMITPFFVTATSAGLRALLFRLGQPGAITLLFVPVLLALLPVIRNRTDTIATLLVAAFAVLASVMLGAYYVPAAIAMALVRFATSNETRRIPTASS